ncbi:MAG: hypothetical protein JXQ66_05800 [Campylobacterales bacterium]|nr:hypothetical protein [Campylobacterales bacterium]
MFFQSLFDYHPEVIGFTYFYDNYKFEFSEFYDGENSTLIDAFIKENSKFFSTKENNFFGAGSSEARKLGKNHDEDFIIDKELFKQNFIDFFGDNKIKDDKTFFIYVHLALAKTLNYDIEDVKYIFVHLHMDTQRMLEFLINNFQESYYFALTRDIRESWLGWKKVLKRRDDKCSCNITMFENIIEWNLRFVELIDFIDSNRIKNGHIKIIELNTLHKLQDKAMRELAKFLDIRYDSCLTKSTFGDKAWIGNSANQNIITGFDINNAPYKWEKELTEFEKKTISTYTNSINRYFGYKEFKGYNKLLINIIFFRYFFVLFFTAFIKLLPFDIITQKDKNILKSINSKDDIQNVKYKKFPYLMAKFFVFTNIFKNRYFVKIKLVKNSFTIIKKHFYILDKNYEKPRDEIFLR